MKNNITITSKYKWYRNPIKLWKQRKLIKIMQIVMQDWYNKEGQNKIFKVQNDLFLYGVSQLDDGTFITYDEYYGK